MERVSPGEMYSIEHYVIKIVSYGFHGFTHRAAQRIRRWWIGDTLSIWSMAFLINHLRTFILKI
jgi:hypothetical protein